LADTTASSSTPTSPPAAVELPHIAIHETYPGHQAERAAKEQLLVRVRDLAR